MAPLSGSQSINTCEDIKGRTGDPFVMAKQLAPTKSLLLENPTLFRNLDTNLLFELFGHKDDSCYNWAIQLWANQNLSVWDTVKALFQQCLTETPELISMQTIQDCFLCPEGTDPKIRLTWMTRVLMSDALHWEALRYRSDWNLKNWGCMWPHRIENGINKQKAMLWAQTYYMKKASLYLQRTSKYLKMDLMAYQNQISQIRMKEMDALAQILTKKEPVMIVEPDILPDSKEEKNNEFDLEF